MEDAAGVSIFLCSDTLLEVLRYLTRQQIINLELAGGRIHRIVKRYLKREPYITRFLKLIPGFLFFYHTNIGTRKNRQNQQSRRNGEMSQKT